MLRHNFLHVVGILKICFLFNSGSDTTKAYLRPTVAVNTTDDVGSTEIKILCLLTYALLFYILTVYYDMTSIF